VATKQRDGRPSILVPLLIALLLLAVIGASVGWFVGTRVNERRDGGYAASTPAVVRGR
jgi:glycerol uptake facilitator-like aquaporin